MDMRHSTDLKTVLLFSALGVLAAGITQILFFAGGYTVFLAFIIPVASILVGTWAASEQGLVSLPLHNLLQRVCISGVLFVLVYPVGMVSFLAILFGVAPPQSFDFDEHVLTPTEAFRDVIAMPLGLLVGGMIVLLLCALAVYVLVGKWPKRVWSLVLTFPLLLALLGLVSSHGAFNERVAFLSSQALMCVITGYWISGVGKKAEAKI